MNWTKKAHQRNKIDNLIKQAMNTPEYREAKRRDMEQATLQALVRFCFIMCEFLELKHGYKHNGLLNFLDFAKCRVVEIGDDEEYFADVEKYYKTEHNVNVLEFLGVEKVGKLNEESR